MGNVLVPSDVNHALADGMDGHVLGFRQDLRLEAEDDVSFAAPVCRYS